MGTLLKGLRRHDAYAYELRDQVKELLGAAALAGEHVVAGQAGDVALWEERFAASRSLPPYPMHSRVGRRYWIARSCPRCHAEQGKVCVLVEATDTGEKRKYPHDERVQLILDGRGYNAPCESPAGPHRSRV
ncbi:hypothetical protein ABT030_45005 [Streptomyces mirabilis]|uniref:zinc finger domain-containing protein n=1 Tax=Streptomyces mirabilis TaxID=68239 RepID=UPI0033289C2C